MTSVSEGVAAPYVSDEERQFREDRQTMIGGSDIGAILGVDKYRTALDVYREKMGEAEPFLGNNHTERGRKLEAVAADEYTERTGKVLWRRDLRVQATDYPFLGGHLDRRVVNERRIVEIKCPSLGAFAKMKREGLPESYILQAQWYMGIARVEHADWMIFCADQWDALIFPVEFDPALFTLAKGAAIEFWTAYVQTRTPPAAEQEAQVEIAKIGGSTEITKRTDAEFAEAARMLREARALKEEAETIESTAKANLLDLIGSKPGCYEGGGLRAYYSEKPGRVTFDKALVAKGAVDLDLAAKVLTGAVMGARLATGQSTDEATMLALDEESRRLLRENAKLDLTKFEKQGKPFNEFRPYFLGRGGE